MDESVRIDDIRRKRLQAIRDKKMGASKKVQPITGVHKK